MATWQNFEFFEDEILKDKDKGVPLFKELEVLCWATGRSQLIFGDHEGIVRMYDRNFKCQQFRAYQGPVYHMCQLKRCLVTVGDDDDEVCVLKVWSGDRDTDRPACLRTIRLFSPAYPPPRAARLQLNVNPNIDLDYTTNDKESVKQSSFCCPVTTVAFAEAEDHHLLAIGLTSGDVILIKGHLIRDKDKQRQTVLRRESHSGPSTKVSFLSFKKLPCRTGFLYALHVLYEDGADLWTISNKAEQIESPGDVPGCQPRSACIADDGRLVVAQRDTLTLFGGEDIKENENSGVKTPAPNCDIKLMGWFRNYMYSVSTMRTIEKDQFTIYDFANSVKATQPNQCSFPNVVCVIAEWNCLFVLFQVQESGSNRVNQRLARLEEKDTQTKLKLLYKKSMYQIAIDLAKAQQFDTSDVMDIYLRYGDYLYQRTDYSRAVQQYIATIGYKEPSYVIRKFLDAQQIHNLTKYLERLHTCRDANERPLANEDHTTLLLNCYTKLKDEKKLDDFIQQERDYNPDTAIKVLRQANYYRHALHLANKFHKHDRFLSIQIEDLKQYDEALLYIHSLDFENAERELQNYGKVLVSKRPMKATSMLMDICTGWKPQSYGLSALDGTRESLSLPQSQDFGESKKKASPNKFLPCFVDVPHHLMKFLEIVKNDLDVKGDDGTKSEPTMVYNTLLELYLTKNLRQTTRGESDEAVDDDEPEGEDGFRDDYEQRKQKALALLKDNKGKYDREHALVLVQTHNFREGILELYETLELYQDIIQYYMEVGDKEELIRCCEHYGKNDPTVWVQVLLYFVELHEKEDVSAETQKVLRHIDEESLLSPLVVIDILGRSKGTKLATIKDYIVKRLEKDMTAIEQDQKEIRELQALTHQYREEIRSQQTQAQTFHCSKCSACQSSLGLPAVYFMCKHSYHTGCLSEQACQICGPGFARTLEVDRQLRSKVEDHEDFFRQLHQPGYDRDGFSVVADFFGRSIFNGEYPTPPNTTSRTL
eukprot:TRINITY_DN19296_c0_g1_i1.p1 TRINITY_DN19296_c0_g1~~TRINITY_DN19296_c0_g1_i1.p1  ORF type:complete len:1011 (+),score=444.11 TRINITY_DN19296_c0_g1_i1:59-3034(+)